MDGGRLRPSLEPVTVVGTLLSILAGLVSFVSGDSDVVLGVVVGLSVQAIALLVQIIVPARYWRRSSPCRGCPIA